MLRLQLVTVCDDAKAILESEALELTGFEIYCCCGAPRGDETPMN